MNWIQKTRRKAARLFYSIGNAVQYYESTDPTLYSQIHWANVNIYYAVVSSDDYDKSTTAVMDAAAEILDGREWTAGARLDIYNEEGE